MKQSTPFLLLMPHALSCVFFITAFVWMDIAETNRSEPDLYLAIAGFGALVLAALASLFLLGLIIAKPETRSGWPWLLVHLAAMVLVAAMGGEWLGSHLA